MVGKDMSLEEMDFQTLLKKIHNERGIDFSQYRPRGLKRRISTRLRARDCSRYRNYIAVLNRDQGEYERLLSAIFINVTEFFRNPRAFEIIEKSLIPEIISEKERGARKTIRVWSGGVSFGEESYSLAILFYEVLKERINDFTIKIFATDIDVECMERARLGSYGKNSLKNVRPQLFHKYFSFVNGNYVVDDKLRLLITYRRHNIISDTPLRHMDLILCRNVAIYFTKPLQEKLLYNLSYALKPGGFLVLGNVESLWGDLRKSFKVIDNRERIYQKI